MKNTLLSCYSIWLWPVPGSLIKLEGRRCHIFVEGTVSRDFRLSVFFHQSTPYRSLINRLKPLRMWVHIRRDNRFESRLNRFQRCQWHRWNSAKKILWLKSLWYFKFHDPGGFSGVNETISAVSMTPRKRFQRCHWHLWNSNNVDFLSEYKAICETV
jgi:hypothetical protein